MCGIVGGLGYSEHVKRGLVALRHRGPDAQRMMQVGNIFLGHARLAIIDPTNHEADQPFCYDNVALLFNGEIWNYRALREELEALGYRFTTLCDTEVVAVALKAWHIDALSRFQGMFSLAWTYDGKTLWLARDRFGETPLHITTCAPFMFASERKALVAMNVPARYVRDLAPGHYLRVDDEVCEDHSYYSVPLAPLTELPRHEATPTLLRLIEQGVRERSYADVPICTMLSGGIDSSIIAAILRGILPKLTAYIAVYNTRARDLICARELARDYNINLVEIAVPVPSPDDLSRVVWHVEMPYKAQVEIGWPCLKIAEAMRADGFKVTFSGEGSDELWASYGFAYYGLQKQDWYSYRRDLFATQSYKNFMRCNKIFMAHSIECRLPFLSTPLVEFALNLPQAVVQEGKSRPKAVMQEACSPLVPASIAWRPKVAFQDGMGLKDAISQVLPHAKTFYRQEYEHYYGG